MRIVRTGFAVILFLALIAAPIRLTASAQTQVDLEAVENFNFVSPEQCSGEPANLDRILELIGGSVEATTTPIDDLPLIEGGEPVDGEDADAVRALLVNVFACMNANDPLRFLNLFSDDFLRTYATDVAGIVEAAAEQSPDEPQQPLDDGYAIVYESDVFELEDGRFTYTVAVAWVTPEPMDAAAEATDLIQLTARNHDGTWLVEELRSESYVDPHAASRCGDDCATPQVSGDGYAGWIMPLDSARENVILFMWGEEIIDVFTPTDAEIAAAEATFVAFLERDASAQESGLLESVSTDERQYFGYETTNGRLLIVNGFCDRLGLDPGTDVITVEDGGSCFWLARYNLDTSTWESIMINGEA